MLRTILATFDMLELLVPDALIDAAESLALENPEECEVRSWVVTAARVEGLLLVLLVQRRDTTYSTFKKLLGVVGLLSIAYPRGYIDLATRVAYTDAADCRWKPWVYHATRLTGLLYVIAAITELRKD